VALPALCLFAVLRLCVHSRSDAVRRWPSGRWFHTPASFRPRGFSPPRRLAPLRGCGFVAPRFRPWGSSRFSRPGAAASEEATGAEAQSPRCGFGPFEGFPSPVAAPHHCGLCLRAVAARPPPRQLALPAGPRAWRPHPGGCDRDAPEGVDRDAPKGVHRWGRALGDDAPIRECEPPRRLHAATHAPKRGG
jgi:hypothetical protein